MEEQTKEPTAVKKPPVKKVRRKREPSTSDLLAKIAVIAESNKKLHKDLRAVARSSKKLETAVGKKTEKLAALHSQVREQSKQVRSVEKNTQRLSARMEKIKEQYKIVTEVKRQAGKMQKQLARIAEAQKELKASGISRKVVESAKMIKENTKTVNGALARLDVVEGRLDSAVTKTEIETLGSSIADDAARSIDEITSTLMEELITVTQKGVIDGEALREEITTLRSDMAGIPKDTNGGAMQVPTEERMTDEIAGLRSDTERYVSDEIVKIREEIAESKRVYVEKAALLLELARYQSVISMSADSKYGDLAVIEKMGDQTADIISLFEGTQKRSDGAAVAGLPQDVKRWAVGRMLDCADRWEIRFVDLYEILSKTMGADIVGESISIPQVRDIYGANTADMIRANLAR